MIPAAFGLTIVGGAALVVLLTLLAIGGLAISIGGMVPDLDGYRWTLLGVAAVALLSFAGTGIIYIFQKLR